MDWLATVDVPAMTLSQAVDKEKEGSVLADVLTALKDSKVKVLFRDELFNMMTYWKCRELNTALDRLSENDWLGYDSCDKSQYVKSNPDMLNGMENEEERQEVKYQLYDFHTRNQQVSKVYLVSRFVPDEKTLQTTLDRKSENHSLVYFQSGDDVLSFMSGNRPRLVQHKHTSSAYTLGGYQVSPFSAHDPNDESAAKALLSQAFDEYQGAIMPNTPPDVLFTRDLANRTYVCFRHSGNWEYHGHDIPTSDPNLPDYIKRKYNIWK